MSANKKRSKTNELLVSAKDYLLTTNGIKTCTSRYGIKINYYKGQQITIKCNEKGYENYAASAVVSKVVIKPLNDITNDETKQISCYGVADHVIDFYSIYKESLGLEVTGDSMVTLIWFTVTSYSSPENIPVK